MSRTAHETKTSTQNTAVIVILQGKHLAQSLAPVITLS